MVIIRGFGHIFAMDLCAQEAPPLVVMAHVIQIGFRKCNFRHMTLFSELCKHIIIGIDWSLIVHDTGIIC